MAAEALRSVNPTVMVMRASGAGEPVMSFDDAHAGTVPGRLTREVGAETAPYDAVEMHSAPSATAIVTRRK